MPKPKTDSERLEQALNDALSGFYSMPEREMADTIDSWAEGWRMRLRELQEEEWSEGGEA